MEWEKGWEENLEKAVRSIKALGKASYVTLSISASGVVKVFAYPNNDVEEKRELINGLTHLVGKLDKKVSGSTISLLGSLNGLEVEITNYDTCEIVGYVEEEVDEVISTGHKVKQRIMVSDCELKQGKYAGKSVSMIEKKEVSNATV